MHDCVGINISELAFILLVKRPTIYAWLKEDNRPIKHNNKRLSAIYNLCLPWKEACLGKMQEYLYREINTGKSFFDLLCEQQLNKKLIEDTLDIIMATMKSEKLEHNKREACLKQHGFEPLSQEKLEHRLNCMTRIAR